MLLAAFTGNNNAEATVVDALLREAVQGWVDHNRDMYDCKITLCIQSLTKTISFAGRQHRTCILILVHNRLRYSASMCIVNIGFFRDSA